MGGIRDDWAEALIQMADEGFALAGGTNSYGIAGSRDMWLVKQMLMEQWYGIELMGDQELIQLLISFKHLLEALH